MIRHHSLLSYHPLILLPDHYFLDMPLSSLTHHCTLIIDHCWELIDPYKVMKKFWFFWISAELVAIDLPIFLPGPVLSRIWYWPNCSRIDIVFWTMNGADGFPARRIHRTHLWFLRSKLLSPLYPSTSGVFLVTRNGSY